ncbi:hypothetical protein F1737_08025 [Methanoplanus sp. FWC-SCC4]|uniref:Uncharacterized protein n=1 Tax=Methanochimaera problematica TaxID=2609417 RepID=A0AA97FE99_9EURY|nr:hypothetical protein [Methanoplanus sp. FWC-SCC4]WOF16639.1 hypothetical protein F1737_08025 [Methanoplanus sp. FWC-SCC4]
MKKLSDTVLDTDTLIQIPVAQKGGIDTINRGSPNQNRQTMMETAKITPTPNKIKPGFKKSEDKGRKRPGKYLKNQEVREIHISGTLKKEIIGKYPLYLIPVAVSGEVKAKRDRINEINIKRTGLHSYAITVISKVKGE